MGRGVKSEFEFVGFHESHDRPARPCGFGNNRVSHRIDLAASESGRFRLATEKEARAPYVQDATQSDRSVARGGEKGRDSPQDPLEGAARLRCIASGVREAPPPKNDPLPPPRKNGASLVEACH